jgi:hypothetical protein
MSSLKSGLVAFFCFISLNAFAHIEKGIYTGTTPDGMPCGMESVDSYFEQNTPHPLNERIKISVLGDTFTVGHPPVINASQAIAHFNHDRFEGILPNSKGAKAILIHMNHEEGSEGPTSFQVISHQWKLDVRESLICEHLVFQK